MKHLSKIVVKDQAETLNKEEMKLIVGGTIYRCCCGMGSTSKCYNVSASNSDWAALFLTNVCSYGMGGCFMD